MPDRSIALRDIVVERGGRLVLDHLSVTFTAGAITAVTGPSGRGKTSLLRLINRLDVPTSGTVEYAGRDVASYDVRQLRRRIGMIFQRPAPFPGTVRANLQAAAPLADAEFDRILRQVGLHCTMLERDTAQLSGGELQRVCLARALATAPEALLLDEPTSSLDAAATEVFERSAHALAAAGMTMVWVTHDPRQRDRVADEVYEIGEPK